jgi:hypothetical protein
MTSIMIVVLAIGILLISLPAAPMSTGENERDEK